MRIAALTAAIVLAFSGPAIGQSDTDGLASLVQRCSKGNCQNAVFGTLSRLERLKLPADEFTNELGYVAMALYQAARVGQDADVERRVAAVLAELAGAAVDPEQQAAFMRVSQAISDGDTALYILDDPFSVSPS